MHPETTPLIEAAEDALAVALHETGGVDLDRIAELLGRSRETAIAELGDRIYLDPEATVALNRDVWVTADAYLSGKIRTKLAAAVAAATLGRTLSAQCRRARKDPAGGSEALRHHRPPRRAVDPSRCRRRLL